MKVKITDIEFHLPEKIITNDGRQLLSEYTR